MTIPAIQDKVKDLIRRHELADAFKVLLEEREQLHRVDRRTIDQLSYRYRQNEKQYNSIGSISYDNYLQESNRIMAALQLVADELDQSIKSKEYPSQAGISKYWLMASILAVLLLVLGITYFQSGRVIFQGDNNTHIDARNNQGELEINQHIESNRPPSAQEKEQLKELEEKLEEDYPVEE